MQGRRTENQRPAEEFLRLQDFTGSSRVSVRMDPDGKIDVPQLIFRLFFLISHLSKRGRWCGSVWGGVGGDICASLLSVNKCVCLLSIPY